MSALPAAAQSRDLDSYLLFALEGIRTKGLTVTGGDIGVNSAEGAISASSHGVIDAPQSDIVTGMMRASVHSRCRNLYSNSVVNPMPDCQPAAGFHALALPLVANPLVACNFPNPFPDLCTGAPPVIVDLGTTRVLPPGTYGNVMVFSAGGRTGTLVLTGGDYFLCSLRAGGRGAQIVVQQPSTVKIANEVNLGASGYLGPDPSSSPVISARDIELYVNGAAVHFSATSEAHARVYAPNAMLRLTHETTIEGTFLARAIRTERIATPPTTTTTTTTVPGGVTTTVRVTTTTRYGVTSTTTTRPSDCASRCGNMHIDVECGEQCDGPDLGGACPGAVCRPNCTLDLTGCSTTTTTLGGPREICGNCIDDDNNGLTDFEDPACCAGAQAFGLTIRRGKLKPRGTTTRLRLKTLLAQAGLQDVNPLKQDVFLQIRPAGASSDVLCAKVPAMKFMRMHKAFKFWDRKHRVASAKGIDDLKIKVRKDGSVRLKTVGRHVEFTIPPQTTLQVTVGFRDPNAGSETANRCSTETRAFRTGHSGRLIVP